jgi:hypothetical protein
MANGIHDVHTGQMQGVSPEQLQQMARAKAAQGQLRGMNNNPSMQAALRNYQGSPLKVRGQGASTAAPNILEALGSVVTRRQGKSQLNEMEKQSQALRGEINEGSMAEQRAKLQTQDYQNKMDAQQNTALAAAKVEAANQKVGANQAAAALKHTRNLEMAKEKAKRQGLKPTGSERKTYTSANRLRGVIDGLNSDFADMGEEEKGQLDRPYIDTVKNMMPAGIGNILEEKLVDTSDKGRRYITKVAKLESDLSKIASGLAVSGYEMADRKKWSPNAEGLTQEERQRRLDNVHGDLLGEVEAFEQYYPEYGIQQQESQPDTNAKGWALKVDANGNEAYVSPDGKQYEEVP